MKNVLWCVALGAAAVAISACQTARNPSVSPSLTLVDAHSQGRHTIEFNEILKLMDRAGVSHTLLALNGHDRRRTRTKKLLSFAGRYPDRITPAVRAKGRPFRSGDASRYERFLSSQYDLLGFGAIGEVLFWHAKKGGGREQFEEVVASFDDDRVKAALSLAKRRRWPFVAHVEFAGADDPQLMAAFETFIRVNADHPFVLIHMGQLEPPDVERLINTHRNIYFMTSHATSIWRNKGYGFIDMFDGSDLTPAWKDLMIRHSSRFVLGFDMVTERDWQNIYVETVELWRAALIRLPEPVREAIAHQNAERLWRLSPTRPAQKLSNR